MTHWRKAALALGLLLAGVFLWSPPALQQVQERLFDQMQAPAPAQGIWVVDVGLMDETGQPWSRATTARLVNVLAKSKPRSIGFDMLFAGDCDSPAALDLQRALSGVPAVLGFLLLAGEGPVPPQSTLAVTDGVDLWQARGADLPCDRFAGTRAAMVLMGDTDATVRRVPVAVAVAGLPQPSLASAMAQAAVGPVLFGQDWLRLPGVGMVALEGGSLRVPPSGPPVWAGRTLAADAVLTGQAVVPDGAVILVGSSLPQRGGLRPTAASPVAPSVQIWADALATLLAGHPPLRPVWGPWAEAGFALLATLAGLGLMSRLPPARAALGVAGGAVVWAGAALALARATGLLLDPALPAAAVGITLLAAMTGKAAAAARAERVLRDRMGQLLPPALVARIASQPKLLRLEGERRDITALFTDIEGFSTATSEMGAEDMVALLDAYFAETAAIVLHHGGMIDKLVGDSIHALFNAPLDQPGHEAAALACAQEIIAVTEVFRAQHGGFGRTRIGLECGPAVLGDVGFGTRIDYTAHGPAVNLAARLQEANKGFGTQICIGPELARRVPGLHPLGEADIRSFGPLRLYTVTA